MPSPAERRIPYERAARAVALALVAFALVRAASARSDSGQVVVHVDAAGAAGARARDSLVARSRAGDAVTWSGEVAAIATASEPDRTPAARTVIRAVSDGALSLADSLGALDSLPAGGGAIETAGVRGLVQVHEGRTGASVAAPVALQPGRVLVLGRVGWESKFVVAALEEAGWSVDAHLRLSDTGRVTQGDARTPTLARHAVVVALDTALGADAAALTRFVRAGGGLVLSGEAAAAPALSAIMPARAGARQEGEPGAFDADDPRGALPMRVLGTTVQAVVLERRDSAVVVAARRLAAGRVVQSGYAETWRWRMQAERSGVRAHREWWSRLVAAAAPANRRPGSIAGVDAPAGSMDESAPLATLVQRLGPSVAAAPATRTASRAVPVWIGAITLLLLVAEWASRRARGAA